MIVVVVAVTVVVPVVLPGPGAMMQEHKSFLIRDLLGDVLVDRVQGIFVGEECSDS